jgi:predicted dehydrogenase
MKSLRTAILGCGRCALKHVVRLTALEEIGLVGFCDASFESADNYNQEFAQGKGRVFTDYRQLLTDLEQDTPVSLELPVEVRSSQEIE